ncbi:MAG: ribose 5-phosphate isomerase B [Bacillota bacterium]
MAAILFVCTGNTCRSPMAEYIFKQLLKERGLTDWEVVSAGLRALPGLEANSLTRSVLSEIGVDVSDHSTTPFESTRADRFDLILTMTAAHRQLLLEQYPELAPRVFSLKEVAGFTGDVDIQDPYGQQEGVYRETREEIRSVLEEIAGKIDYYVNKAGKTEVITNIIKEIKGVDPMKIAIACDHAGVDLKQEIMELMAEQGLEYQDLGTDDDQSVDYPDYAYRVAHGVAEGNFDRGILICGTGIGMSIAANKVDGVRAALCHDVFSARAAGNHNQANVLTMGARVIGSGLARDIVQTWLEAGFDGGRHQRRVNKIADIERGDYTE